MTCLSFHKAYVSIGINMSLLCLMCMYIYYYKYSHPIENVTDTHSKISCINKASCHIVCFRFILVGDIVF